MFSPERARRPLGAPKQALKKNIGCDHMDPARKENYRNLNRQVILRLYMFGWSLVALRTDATFYASLW